MLNGWLKVVVKRGDICYEDCEAITNTARRDLLDLSYIGKTICYKGGP